jgi:hypothetical protein
MDAARSEAALRDFEAAAFAEQDVAGGTRTFSSRICAWPCGASSKPNTGSIFSMVMPGVSSGTRICDCC